MVDFVQCFEEQIVIYLQIHGLHQMLANDTHGLHQEKHILSWEKGNTKQCTVVHKPGTLS